MSIFARIMVRDFDAYSKLIEGTEIDVLDENGASLLRIAIAYGSEPIGIDLVERGIKIDQLDNGGTSELQNALSKGFWVLSRLLLERGASISHVDSHGNNALWYASTHPRPDYDLVRLLVEKGGDVSTKNRAGRSPLSAAKERGNVQMVELLESAING